LFGIARSHKVAVACMLAMMLCATAAAAEDWPSRPMTLIVPFGAGSGSDYVARIISARLSEILGQQIVIENVGGAGGVVGVSRVARAPPDGYQLVLGAVDTFAQGQALYKKPVYDSAKDFTPVALAVEQPLLLTVRNELPVNDLTEFVSYVKVHQSTMQFGSAGVGAAPHLACYQLTSAIGATVTHVPYRGSAPALQDMIAGRLDYYCPLAGAGIPLIMSKSIKALAILTQDRSPLLPDLPTAKEQGLDFTDGYYWIGFFLPQGTPEPIVKKLNTAICAALDTPSVQTRLRELATTVVASDRRSPGYLQTFVASEIRKWAGIIKASGIEPQ
jgi:tripartite-type tricarboxylate transporter receptor subunit TctC